MPFKRTFSLKGQTWTVRVVERILNSRGKPYKRERRGQIDYEAREIQILEGMRDKSTIGTLYHEFLHKEFPRMGEKRVLRLEAEFLEMLSSLGLV